MEDRMKTLYVSKTLKQKRQEDLVRIQSDYGVQLRMNRSIQAEGSFADVKADMAFRRYTYRSLDNVTAQSVILAIAHNINKYHNKIRGCVQLSFRLKGNEKGNGKNRPHRSLLFLGGQEFGRHVAGEALDLHLAPDLALLQDRDLGAAAEGGDDVPAAAGLVPQVDPDALDNVGRRAGGDLLGRG